MACGCSPLVTISGDWNAGTLHMSGGRRTVGGLVGSVGSFFKDTGKAIGGAAVKGAKVVDKVASAPVSVAPDWLKPYVQAGVAPLTLPSTLVAKAAALPVVALASPKDAARIVASTKAQLKGDVNAGIFVARSDAMKVTAAGLAFAFPPVGVPLSAGLATADKILTAYESPDQALSDAAQVTIDATLANASSDPNIERGAQLLKKESAKMKVTLPSIGDATARAGARAGGSGSAAGGFAVAKKLSAAIAEAKKKAAAPAAPQRTSAFTSPLTKIQQAAKVAAQKPAATTKVVKFGGLDFKQSAFSSLVYVPANETVKAKAAKAFTKGQTKKIGDVTYTWSGSVWGGQKLLERAKAVQLRTTEAKVGPKTQAEYEALKKARAKRLADEAKAKAVAEKPAVQLPKTEDEKAQALANNTAVFSTPNLRKLAAQGNPIMVRALELREQATSTPGYLVDLSGRIRKGRFKRSKKPGQSGGVRGYFGAAGTVTQAEYVKA